MIYKTVVEIIEKYDAIMLDVWGVLHASGILYKNTLPSIQEIRKRGVKILLISNAPRRSAKLMAFLAELGIIQGVHYDDAITSGESFFLQMKNRNSCRAFYLGLSKDLETFAKIPNIKITHDIEESYDFAVATGMVPGYKEILLNLLEKKKPLHCLNPDIIIIKSNKEEEKCAGFIASEYKKMGGNVLYYGKPDHLIYEQGLDILKTLKPDITKQKILAVGDGMETDILGANNFGIDSALCLTGIPSAIQTNISIEEYIGHFAVRPKFILDGL